MGMLTSLSVMWLITDLLHHKHEFRKHLRVPHILTKVDVSSILFFLGILLSIHAVETTGLLKASATWLDRHVGSEGVIATIIGLSQPLLIMSPLLQRQWGCMMCTPILPTLLFG